MLQHHLHSLDEQVHQREVQPIIDMCYKRDIVMIGPGNI